jgi:ribose 5-phosphate isomerase B
MDPKEIESLVRSLVAQRLEGASAEPKASEGTAALKVVTELDVREAGAGGRIQAARKAIVTTAAEELACSLGVTIRREGEAAVNRRRVALGADHGGYALKEEIKRFLESRDDVEIRDLGTHDSSAVDYPDFAHAVAEAVASGKADLGIVVDAAGIGSAIAANKVPGIRAAMCYDAPTARSAREHNFANVLTLGGRTIDTGRMRGIVRAFLETAPGEDRHAARVRKIIEIEKRYRR